jgi:DNA-binding NtrC family response regulator
MKTVPPRVLIVMPDQWPRALLRADLRQAGYDAVGTRNLSSAQRIRADEPDRGPVRLVVVDQSALGESGDDQLARLVTSHNAPATMLLARPTVPAPGGKWRSILRRPVSVGQIVAAAQELLPLPAEDRHPLD